MNDLKNCSSLDLEEALMTQLEEMQTEIKGLKHQLGQKELEISNLKAAAGRFRDERNTAQNRVKELETSITTLTSEKSSEMQELLSTMQMQENKMLQQAELIEKLHESDLILQKNQELQQEHRDLRAKAQKAENKARETEETAKKEIEKERKSVKTWREIYKDDTKKVNACVCSLGAVIGIAELVRNRAVFALFWTWIVDRGRQIGSFFSWLWGLFLSLSALINGLFPEPAPDFLGCGISAVAVLGVAFGLLWAFFALELDFEIGMIIDDLKEYWRMSDAPVFDMITVMALFYVCVIFAEPFMALVPLNIVTIWLVLSVAAIILIHVIEAIIRKKRGY